MSKLAVSVVIVTYQSEAVIRPCLETIINCVQEVIIVDNASTDQTVSIANDMGAKIIQAGANLGYGRANNLGVSEAHQEWVLIMNPDCRIHENDLSKLLEIMNSRLDLAAVAPILQEADGRIMRRTQSHLDKSKPLAGHDQITGLSGACFLCSKAAFQAVDGFDPAIFLFYEDDDFFRKLKLKGYELDLIHEVKVFHDRGNSSAPSLKSVFTSRYHQAWSRFYIDNKYEIRSKPLEWLIRHGIKYLLSAIGLQTNRMARYGGSFCGACDFLMRIERRNP